MFCGILYAILLGWFSWEDIKHLRIFTIGLVVLGCISLSQVLMSPDPLWIPLLIALGMYSGLRLLNCGMTHLAKNPALGQGDIWLMSILAAATVPEQVPFFVLMVGVVSLPWGMCWTYRQGHPRFPMVPPISVAFMLVRLF